VQKLARFAVHLRRIGEPIATHPNLVSGPWQVGDDIAPDIIGYDRVMKIDTTRVSDVAPAAIEFLEGPPPQPFFLSVGFFETHRSFFEPAAGADHGVRPPPNLPDGPETRLDMASFIESARSLDRGVGRVLDSLDAQGLADNTIVICTTDHGIAFPGGKATMTDVGCGVLLIWTR